MERSEVACCGVPERWPGARVRVSIIGDQELTPEATCTIEEAAWLFSQCAESDDAEIAIGPSESPAESTFADFTVLLYLLALTILLTFGVVRSFNHPLDYRPVCNDLSAGNHVPACA